MASSFHAPPISSLIHSWEDFSLNRFEPTVLLQLFNFSVLEIRRELKNAATTCSFRFFDPL
jgi:hypothetical protein